jgi:hypothetical protein
MDERDVEKGREWYDDRYGLGETVTRTRRDEGSAGKSNLSNLLVNVRRLIREIVCYDPTPVRPHRHVRRHSSTEEHELNIHPRVVKRRPIPPDVSPPESVNDRALRVWLTDGVSRPGWPGYQELGFPILMQTVQSISG